MKKANALLFWATLYMAKRLTLVAYVQDFRAYIKDRKTSTPAWWQFLLGVMRYIYRGSHGRSSDAR